MLAPANSELPRGDGWVTSGLRAIFHKGKVVVRGREGMALHVFETCCAVMDAAFVALEHSKVDWRAPDFGTLAHYFELFVTNCFQGIFIERAMGFRVGLIKARFCNAILTQFLDEFSRSGTIIFRSHWDVASLARVFYSLGLGDDADVEFWKSFVDGGSIGPEFLAKAFTTLQTAERDGPLLNFCKLGQLGTMAVPFEGSGLKDADFEKLSDLMQKMTDDSRLPWQTLLLQFGRIYTD
jgi:hypothetical protein